MEKEEIINKTTISTSCPENWIVNREGNWYVHECVTRVNFRT